LQSHPEQHRGFHPTYYDCTRKSPSGGVWWYCTVTVPIPTRSADHRFRHGPKCSAFSARLSIMHSARSRTFSEALNIKDYYYYYYYTQVCSPCGCSSEIFPASPNRTWQIYYCYGEHGSAKLLAGYDRFRQSFGRRPGSANCTTPPKQSI